MVSNLNSIDNYSYKYQFVYENFPIGIWEEDWSAIKRQLDKLTELGIQNLKTYLYSHLDVAFNLYQLIGVLSVNQTAINQYQASSQEQLVNYIANQQADLSPFIDSLTALYAGSNSIQVDGWGRTLTGNAICFRDCRTIAPGYEDNWSYVITASEDITTRKMNEVALADNEANVKFLNQNMPIGLWEDDYSKVKILLDALPQQHRNHLRDYLEKNNAFVDQLKHSVKHISVNFETLRQYGYQQHELDAFLKDYSGYPTPSFINEILSLYIDDDNNTHVAQELDRFGNKIYLLDTFHIPKIYSVTWSKVITTSMDISDQVKKDNIIEGQITHLQQASKIAKICYWTASQHNNEDVKFIKFLSDKFNLTTDSGTVKLKDIYNFIHPDDKQRVKKTNTFAFQNAVGYQVEYRLLSEAGQITHIREIAEVNKDDDGVIIGYHGTLQDISHQFAQNKRLKSIEKKASQLEVQFVNAINAISEGIALYDDKDVLIKSNNTYNDYFNNNQDINISDFQYQDLISLHLKKISTNETALHVDEWNASQQSDTPTSFEFADGKFWFNIKKETQSDNSYTVTLSDITEQKIREIMFEQLSIMDELTNLFNRRKFNESLDSEFRRCMRDQKPLSVLICDIDEFKQYNDHYGHLQGDECLKAIAKSIQDQFHRVGDVVARYGGEEFAIILPNSNIKDAEKLAAALCNAVSSKNIPHAHSSNGKHVTLSVGVATTDFGLECDKLDLIEAADLALYNAKDQGRNCVRSNVL